MRSDSSDRLRGVIYDNAWDIINSLSNMFTCLLLSTEFAHYFFSVVESFFRCNLHKFALNREPLEFEFTWFLVDGSHWVRKTFSFATMSLSFPECIQIWAQSRVPYFALQPWNRAWNKILCFQRGHKTLKKPDSSGRGGHIGCSEGELNFTFHNYVHSMTCINMKM